MDNRIKIFFEDSDDDMEKTFEKHSQEMRARMDSAFGSARSDSLFDRAQPGSSSNSIFQRSDPFKEADDFFSNSRSLFNSNDRGSPPSITTMMPLGTSSRIGFPMDSIGSAPANDIKWTDETHWEKEIPLNSQHSYSNIGVKCKENFLEIGASEEVVEMNNGKKTMSKSQFKTSFSIPAGTNKKTIQAETTGAKIIVRGEVEKKNEVKEEKATEIPIQFE